MNFLYSNSVLSQRLVNIRSMLCSCSLSLRKVYLANSEVLSKTFCPRMPQQPPPNIQNLNGRGFTSAEEICCRGYLRDDYETQIYTTFFLFPS